jgi:hypothetical protein
LSPMEWWSESTPAFAIVRGGSVYARVNRERGLSSWLVPERWNRSAKQNEITVCLTPSGTNAASGLLCSSWYDSINQSIRFMLVANSQWRRGATPFFPRRLFGREQVSLVW